VTYQRAGRRLDTHAKGHHRRATAWYPTAVAVALIAVVTGLLLGNWLSGELPISHRREALTEMTIIWMFRQELLSGQMLSGWNPLWFSGFPWLRFLAYPVYYVLAGISAWGGLSLERLMVVFYILVMAGSALALFAYLRTVVGDWRAALVGALIYELFPFHSHVGVETWVHAAFWALLPLPLWTIERSRTSGPRRTHWILLTGLFLGLFPILNTEYAIIASPFVVLYILARLIGDVAAGHLRWPMALRDAFLVGAVSLGISCFLVLPGLLETNAVGIHAKHGADTTFTDALLRDYAVTPRLVGYAILKRFHALGIAPSALPDELPGIVRSFWSVAWYPGMVAPLMALLGLWAVRRRFAAGAALIGGLLAMVVALGPTSPLNVFSHVPVLGRLSPFRFLMIAVACASILAAHGLDRLLSGIRRRWTSRWLGWAPWSLALLVLVAVGLDFKDAALAYQTTPAYYDADSEAAYAWLDAQEAPGRLWELAAEPREEYLRTYSLSRVPRARHSGYYDNGAALHTWQQLAWTDLRTVLRLHQVRYVLVREDELDSGFLASSDLLPQLAQIGYRRAHVSGPVQVWEYEGWKDVTLYSRAALDITDDFFRSFEALPHLVWRDIAMVSPDGLGADVPAQDLAAHDWLLVSADRRDDPRWQDSALHDRLVTVDELETLPNANRPWASLWMERPTYGSLLVQVESDSGGVLTVSESWYPHWRVYVNGRPQPTLRVNWALLGVRLEPGRHQVSFRFEQPAYVHISYAISLMTLLLLVIWWSWYVGRMLDVDMVVWTTFDESDYLSPRDDA
jgi:hypothetical protein